MLDASTRIDVLNLQAVKYTDSADACVYYGRCPVADKELGCDRRRPPLLEIETDHCGVFPPYCGLIAAESTLE